MSKLYDFARVTTATLGSGTVTLGSVVAPFLSLAQAGVQDQDQITYVLTDYGGVGGLEVGRGTYTSSGPSVSRITVLTSTSGGVSGDRINLTGSAQVTIAAAAVDQLTSGATALWNVSSSTYTAVKISVTDTLSQPASLLMDLQKDGTSQFKVGKSGYFQGHAVTFSSAPGSPVEGTLMNFTDSQTQTWGATITAGGSSFHVLARYNGTNWTVVGT